MTGRQKIPKREPAQFDIPKLYYLVTTSAEGCLQVIYMVHDFEYNIPAVHTILGRFADFESAQRQGMALLEKEVDALAKAAKELKRLSYYHFHAIYTKKKADPNVAEVE